MVVRVDDADRDDERGRPVREPAVDLVDDLADPLVLPHPQHRHAAGPLHAGGEDRRTREWRMPADADVPLDSSGEPGLAQREVGGLEGRVRIQEFASAREVDERTQPAAEVEQELRAYPVVLEDCDPMVPGGEGAVVPVLEEVREEAGDAAVLEVRAHLVIEVGGLDVRVQLRSAGQRGQRVDGSQRRTGQRGRAEAEAAHSGAGASRRASMRPFYPRVRPSQRARSASSVRTPDVMAAVKGTSSWTASTRSTPAARSAVASTFPTRRSPWRTGSAQ